MQISRYLHNLSLFEAGHYTLNLITPHTCGNAMGAGQDSMRKRVNCKQTGF